MSSSYFPVKNPTTSYWLSKPHHLAKYCSSSQVPEECDVAIIGTGLAGVSTAYHILEQSKGSDKPRVVLFEARDACSGATGRNGGHIKAGMPSLKALSEAYGLEKLDELAEWVADQRRQMKITAEKEGIDCDMLVTRSYDAYFDQSQANSIKAWIKGQQQRGVEWTNEVQWLEGDNLERVTGIKGIQGAAGVPATSLSPYKFVMGLLSRVLDAGASLYTNTPVNRVDKEIKDDTSSANILVTDRGNLRAQKVIFATNGYSAALLPQFKDVIVPIRGQACQLVPNVSTHHGLNLATTYNLLYTPKTVDYLNPRPDGAIVLGGGSGAFRKDPTDRNPSWFGSVDDSHLINDNVSKHFNGVMGTHFRGWEKSEAKVNITWTGIMGNTQDGVPHAGQIPDSGNQWILAGFNGGGMAMIFTLSRAIAQMAMTDTDFESTNIPSMFKTTPERISQRRFDI